jgi:hypothetical protein
MLKGYTEIVEVGHIDFVGGSVEITIFDDYSSYNKELLKNKIDMFDHTTIIPENKKEIKNITKRYFIVKQNKDFLILLALMIHYLLKEDHLGYKKIRLKWNNETLIAKYDDLESFDNPIIEYNIEG